MRPYPSYKDSGVEWLGEVPAHWTIRPLRALAKLTTGITPPTDDQTNYSEGAGFPWLRPEDIDEKGHSSVASKLLTAAGQKYVRDVDRNSTLICCIGTIGKCGYVDRICSTNQQITSASFGNSSRYFFFYCSRPEVKWRLCLREMYFEF